MRFLLIFVFSLFVVSFVYAQNNETLTITTYYPSPYGVYRNLKLSPSNEPTAGVSEGVMYYNRTLNQILFRNDTRFVPLGGQTSGYRDGDVFYNQTDTEYYVYNSTGNIWIEAPSPGSGGVITKTGTNPTCPAGATTLTRDWTSVVYDVCIIQNTHNHCATSGGWSLSAPTSSCSCPTAGFGCGSCTKIRGGVGGAGSYCSCVGQSWTMVMCQS